MNDASKLRTPLMVEAIYGIIVGVLLLFPSLAASVFAYTTKDTAVTSGWGTGLIAIGLLAWVAASDVGKYGGMAWVFVVGLLLAAVDLVYFWATGAYTARNVVVPVILNVALAVWIWSARPKG